MRSITRKSRLTSDTALSGTVENVVSTLEQLLDQGENFTSLSIDQLAKKSGIARATFYLHFRNKGDLVSHLMRRVASEIRAAATEPLADKEHFGRDEFLMFMRNVIEVNFLHRAAMRAIIETSSYDPEVATIYHHFMQQRIADTRGMISKLHASGRARADIRPELADVLTWAAERCCDQMLRDKDTLAQRQTLAELLTHVVWCSIALQ